METRVCSVISEKQGESVSKASWTVNRKNAGLARREA